MSDKSNSKEIQNVSNNSTKKKISHKEERFYQKGFKSRQRYLISNHASTSAFIIGLLSNYFYLIIGFPVKLSTVCLNFPRLRTVLLSEIEEINVYEIIIERTKTIKKEMERENPNKSNRINFITHFEIYHMVHDLMELIEDFEIIGEIEEPSGLSGDFKIRVRDKIYEWEEIKEKGEEILKRMYGNRQQGEQRRCLKKGSCSDLFNF